MMCHMSVYERLISGIARNAVILRAVTVLSDPQRKRYLLRICRFAVRQKNFRTRRQSDLEVHRRACAIRTPIIVGCIDGILFQRIGILLFGFRLCFCLGFRFRLCLRFAFIFRIRFRLSEDNFPIARAGRIIPGICSIFCGVIFLSGACAGFCRIRFRLTGICTRFRRIRLRLA